MKLALVLAALLAPLALASGDALAAPPRCDNAALIRSLVKLQGSRALKVVRADGAVALELVHGSSRETVLRATCDAIEAPIADLVDRPTRDAKTAVTRVVDGIVISRSANGAVSLELPAGLADGRALSVLVLDDDSVSLALDGRVYYALQTTSDGTTIETEGIGNGCGCERKIAPDGKILERRLLR